MQEKLGSRHDKPVVDIKAAANKTGFVRTTDIYVAYDAEVIVNAKFYPKSDLQRISWMARSDTELIFQGI